MEQRMDVRAAAAILVGKPDTMAKKEAAKDEFDLFHLVDQKTWPAENDSFFGDLQLSKNGGLFDIHKLAQVKVGNWIGMTSFLVMGGLNIIKMILGNIRIIQGQEKPLHTKIFLSLNLTGNSPRVAVAVFELLGLAYFFYQILKHLYTFYKSLPATSEGPRAMAIAKFHKWNAAAKILHHELPSMKSFSSMRVVQYVIPSVMLPDFKAIRMQKKKKSLRKKLQAYSWFFLVRLCFLVIGFEAFLVKFSEASLYLENVSVNSGIKMALFLNQMLGVVELNMFLRKRLFFFIFAGVDNVMDKAERRRMAVWEAGFVMKSWEHFEGNFMKFFAYTLTFNDSAFQELSLTEEDEKKKD
jgi:hypothetical protein